jgi:hypothetical protein
VSGNILRLLGISVEVESVDEIMGLKEEEQFERRMILDDGGVMGDEGEII